MLGVRLVRGIRMAQQPSKELRKIYVLLALRGIMYRVRA